MTLLWKVSFFDFDFPFHRRRQMEFNEKNTIGIFFCTENLNECNLRRKWMDDTSQIVGHADIRRKVYWYNLNWFNTSSLEVIDRISGILISNCNVRKTLLATIPTPTSTLLHVPSCRVEFWIWANLCSICIVITLYTVDL